MSDQPITLDETLTTTKDQLGDVLGWAKRGAYIVLYSTRSNNYGRFFHKCTKKQLNKDETKEYMDTHRFIYVDVSRMPALLDDGEWEYYIKCVGVDECSCNIKYTCDSANNVPHATLLRS